LTDKVFHILRVHYSFPENMPQSYAHRTCQFTYTIHFHCYKQHTRNYILGQIFKFWCLFLPTMCTEH